MPLWLFLFGSGKFSPRCSLMPQGSFKLSGLMLPSKDHLIPWKSIVRELCFTCFASHEEHPLFLYVLEAKPWCWCSAVGCSPLCSTRLVLSYCHPVEFLSDLLSPSCIIFFLEMLSPRCITFLAKHATFLAKSVVLLAKYVTRLFSLLWLNLLLSFAWASHFRCLALVCYLHIAPCRGGNGSGRVGFGSVRVMYVLKICSSGIQTV